METVKDVSKDYVMYHSENVFNIACILGEELKHEFVFTLWDDWNIKEVYGANSLDLDAPLHRYKA